MSEQKYPIFYNIWSVWKEGVLCHSRKYVTWNYNLNIMFNWKIYREKRWKKEWCLRWNNEQVIISVYHKKSIKFHKRTTYRKLGNAVNKNVLFAVLLMDFLKWKRNIVCQLLFFLRIFGRSHGVITLKIRGISYWRNMYTIDLTHCC